MFVKSAVCWAFAAMLIAAAASASAADDSQLVDRAASWEKEYNAGNLPAVLTLYAGDGCRMPPNQEQVCGPQAILAQLKHDKELGIAKVAVVVTAAESSGDLSYGRGTFEAFRADGSRIDHGKWMNVSKKEGDTWKIQCDIFNSDITDPLDP